MGIDLMEGISQVGIAQLGITMVGTIQIAIAREGISLKEENALEVGTGLEEGIVSLGIALRVGSYSEEDIDLREGSNLEVACIDSKEEIARITRLVINLVEGITLMVGTILKVGISPVVGTVPMEGINPMVDTNLKVETALKVGTNLRVEIGFKEDAVLMVEIAPKEEIDLGVGITLKAKAAILMA